MADASSSYLGRTLNCRSCGAPLATPFVDLGMSPISNAMRRPDQAGEAEAFYPLRTFVCDVCRLVQIEDVAAILRACSKALDRAYIENWLGELDIEKEWSDARAVAGI